MTRDNDTMPTGVTQADRAEDYEIGKRDGYEQAIQDIDEATGGDGEFRGSTIAGETVDIPAMKQRVIERLTQSTPLLEAVKEARPYVADHSGSTEPSPERTALLSRLNELIGEE